MLKKSAKAGFFFYKTLAKGGKLNIIEINFRGKKEVMMLLMRTFGVVLFLIGLWQFYATWKYHHFLTTKGTDNAFSPLALYYGFALGVVAFLLGLGLMISPQWMYGLIQ